MKKLTKLRILSVVLGIFLGSLAISRVNASSIILNESNGGIVADSLVYSAAANTNYGTEQYTYVGYNEFRSHIIINMGIVPAGAIITDVNYSINVYHECPTCTVCAYNTTPSWTEYALTWNNQPANLTQQGACIVPNSVGWWGFNLTNASIASYNNATNQNTSINLRTTATLADNINVRSKEYATASQRPQVTVTYTIPPPTESTNMTLWLNGTQANSTYSVGTYANFTAQINVSGLTVYLASDYNGFVQQSGTTTKENSTYLNSIGTNFNLTAYYSGNGSFVASSRTFFFNVTVPAGTGGVCLMDYGVQITFISDKFNNIKAR